MLYKTEKKSKGIVHPIFLECSKLSVDKYYKQFYDNLAKGKSPHKNIYINGFTIVSSVAKKQLFSYCFENKSPSKIIVELYKLLMQNTNMSSTTDTEAKYKELDKCNNDEIVCRWKSIRKKNIKEQLILEYVIEQKKKKKLDANATRELHRLIKFGMFCKTQTSDSFEMNENGKIKKIHGIKYDKTLGRFVNKIKIKEEALSAPEQKVGNCIYHHWPLVIKEYNSKKVN